MRSQLIQQTTKEESSSKWAQLLFYWKRFISNECSIKIDYRLYRNKI